MLGINIHSASPVSSDSTDQDLAEQRVIVMDATDTASESATALKMNSPEEESTASNGEIAERKPSTSEATMEDVPLVLDSQAETRPSTSDAASSISDQQATEQPNQSYTGPPRRSVPRIHTRQTSISATADLPWNIDNTSSPSTFTSTSISNSTYTPSYPARKSSIAPPPRAGEAIQIHTHSHNGSLTDSPTLSPIHSPYTGSPSLHSHSHSHFPPSPYSTSSSPRIQTPPHMHSLSHPPGYTQNTRAILSNSDALYTSNTSPLYPRSQTAPYPASYAANSSPTRRGRGILDNDPSIYLGNDDDPNDESMWDTATKWARAAGKRFSTGDIGLWKLVGGEER